MDLLDLARPPQGAETKPRVATTAHPAGPALEGRGRWWRASVLVPVALVLVAGGLRTWGLSRPAQPYWDETYYVPDAYDYLGGGYLFGHLDDPSYKIVGEITWVHPPLGKWMIALGIGPLGLRPIGWRLPSALAGTAGVVLVYLLALALWRSVWWAGLAGLLLALDGLHVVQSRMAMLDVFLTTFVTAGVLLLVLDRRAARHAADSVQSPRWVDRTFGTKYRLWAGVMLGAAVATKWSGLFALALAAGLSAWWLPQDGRRARTIVACFVLVPLLVYLASYWVWFAQNGPDLPRFVALQWRMLQHQLHHVAAQPENSSATSWPLLAHPIRYNPPPGAVPTGREIWLVGNPVLWWGFLLAGPLLALRVAIRRRWYDAVPLGGYLAMYVPWFAFGRTQFLFYMLPAVPFMCLGVVAALRGLHPRWRGRVTAGFTAMAVLAAMAYAPVWLGLHASARWLGFRLPLIS